MNLKGAAPRLAAAFIFTHLHNTTPPSRPLACLHCNLFYSLVYHTYWDRFGPAEMADQDKSVGHQFSPESHATNTRLQIRSLEGYTEPTNMEQAW